MSLVAEQRTLDRPALATLERHSEHPSAFLALNAETLHFRAEGIDGLIAYRPCGGWFFSLGGPFAAEEDRAKLLDRFRAHAREQGKRICALQLRREDVSIYEQAGYHVNQLGRSYSLELRDFSTRGTRFLQLRNKVNRARREGVTVVELGVDRPRDAALESALDALTQEWLRSKGRFKKLLAFLIGELGGAYDDQRRTFLALQGEKVVGFTTYVPVWGSRSGYMLDLSRRLPDTVPGVMELVNVTAIERFRAETASWLHFGLTPFQGCGSETDDRESRSKAVSWLLAKLLRHGSAIYPAQSQADYKLKWFPGLIAPEYFAFEGRFRLGCLVQLLLLTRSI